jgi:hypothetical protein
MAKRKKSKFVPQENKYLHLLSEELKGEITGQRIHHALTLEESEFLRQEYRIRSIPICWGIPMDEVMFSKWFVNFLRLSSMPWDSISTTESTYLPSARNDIHNIYLTDTDAPYLMMLDSDVLPPPNIVDILMSHQKHIVGGWYRNKSLRKGPHPIVYDFYQETEKELQWMNRAEPGIGLEKVDGMGAGCWLMSRELAEALGENPYSMERGTEDLVLCKKIMDLGYEMWVDWDLPCAHMGVSWV